MEGGVAGLGVSAGFVLGGKAVGCVYMQGGVHCISGLPPHTACPPTPPCWPRRPLAATAREQHRESACAAAGAQHGLAPQLSRRCGEQHSVAAFRPLRHRNGLDGAGAVSGAGVVITSRPGVTISCMGRVRKLALHSQAEGHTDGGVLGWRWYPQPMPNDSFEIISSEITSFESRHRIRWIVCELSMHLREVVSSYRGRHRNMPARRAVAGIPSLCVLTPSLCTPPPQHHATTLTHPLPPPPLCSPRSTSSWMKRGWASQQTTASPSPPPPLSVLQPYLCPRSCQRPPPSPSLPASID